MRALPTLLPGLVVVEPVVHRDARGFFLETFRADRMAELGIRETTGCRTTTPARRAACCGACTSRSAPARPSSCAAPAGRCSTWRWTSAAARPPSGAGRRWCSTTSRCGQVYLPVGFAHGFVVTSEVADVIYRCSDYYDPVRRAGLRLGRPGRGISWPDLAFERLGPRRRRRRGCAEIADELPFVYSSGRPGPGEHAARTGSGRSRRRRPTSSARPRAAAARAPRSARRGSSAIRPPQRLGQRRGPAGQREARRRVAHHLEVGPVVAHQQRRAGGHALHDHRVGAAHLGGRAHHARSGAPARRSRRRRRSPGRSRPGPPPPSARRCSRRRRARRPPPPAASRCPASRWASTSRCALFSGTRRPTKSTNRPGSTPSRRHHPASPGSGSSAP